MTDEQTIAIMAATLLAKQEISPESAVDLAASILALARRKQAEYAETAQLRDQFREMFENPSLQR